MRKIKFRAWSKSNKRFVPDNELQVHALGDGVSKAGLNQSLEILGVVFELSQFTGLKDKNGKEIYEGDILKEPESGQVDLVEWIAVDGGFATKTWFGPKDLVEWADSHEVIGNIYENPDLIHKNE